MNIRLLDKLHRAARRNVAITLSKSEESDWHELCAAMLGADVWSWRIQDRDWENNNEPLRIATKAGESAIRIAGISTEDKS